jgi:putative CocE/NonD family hydrolase
MFGPINTNHFFGSRRMCMIAYIRLKKRPLCPSLWNKSLLAVLMFFVLISMSPLWADVVPSKKSYTRYQYGIWTGKIKYQENMDSSAITLFERHPHTWKESVENWTVAYRDGGGFLVEKKNGTAVLWESPTRLVLIDKTGMRQVYDSEYPIMVLEPKYLQVNVGVIKEYYDTHAVRDPLKLSVLLEDELVDLKFHKGKKVGGRARGKDVSVWVWNGKRVIVFRQFAEQKVEQPLDLILTDDMDLLGMSYPVSDDVWIEDGHESLTSMRFWNDPQLSKPVYKVVPLEKKTMIEMSDGASLAATIYLPAEPEKTELTPVKERFPTILKRTPYGRMNYLRDAFLYVSRGYAVMAQDTRGRGDSEGEFHPLVDEKADGDETIDWIAAQPWSDGNVGMIGGSYVGLVQWHAAYKGNSHLKTLVSQVTAGPGLNDCPFVYGSFMPGILTWSVWMNGTPKEIDAAMKKDLNKVVSELPLIDADKRAIGREIPFWREWLAHPTLDDFWKRSDISRFAENIDLPVLYLTGWFDDVLRGTIFYWDMMKRKKRENQYIVLGPWRHGMNTARDIAKLKFGPDAILEHINYIYVRWYDRWLKGIKNGVEKDPKVRYFTVGENTWKTADTWPPRDAREQKWYLQSSGRALAPQDRATVSPRVPRNFEPDRYVYDPQNPTPFLVDIRTNELSPPEDYQEVEKREDTLVYTSESFREDFVISGEVVAVLYAASDARDTDWVVRLTDVHPDGQSIRLVDGFMKARFRNGLEKEVLIKPDRIYKYSIPMTWISHRFKKGHRLRISIASAAAGLLAVNTNTGNPYATDTEYKLAHQAIYHSKKYPSHIILPVVK